jgi:peptide/nickel transport system permease protein
MSVVESVFDRISLSKSQRVELQLYKQRIADSWHVFRQNRPAMFGLYVVAFVILMAIFAPYIAPYDPFTSHQKANGLPALLEQPTLEHPMGTTSLARDVFSQWVYGSRVSLMVGFLSGITVLVIGTTVGLVSGYYKGKVDLVIMRVVDVLYAIPAVPLILVIALFFGSSVWNVIIGMMLVLWRTMARVIRSQTMSLSERPFVKAARASGASDLRIMYVHIAPNLVPLMLVEGTFVIGAAIIIEAGISFLGLGATEMVSWGTMLQLTFSSGAINQAWWWVLPPGLSITVLVVSFFYISRGIEDVTNPQLNR